MALEFMVRTRKVRGVLSAIVLALLVSFFLIVSQSWPAEIRSVYDGGFYLSLIALLGSYLILFHIYCGDIGRGRNERALLCLSVIVLASISYMCFETVAENLVRWNESIGARHWEVWFWSEKFVLYGRTLALVGAVAVAAGLLANSFPEDEF